MTQELKPCPFCGGEAEYFELSWATTAFSGHMYASPFWQIRCKDCRATLGDFKTKQDAFDAWNTRANDEVFDARLHNLIERLRDVLHGLEELEVADA